MTEPERARRVLAVDDSDVWRDMLGDILTSAGVDHEVVEDADTAVAKLETGEFTGVITDGLNGAWQEVADAAAEAGVPLALVSGSLTVVNDAKIRGLAGFSKPIPDVQELIQVVTPDS